MDGIPDTLPALLYATKVLGKAAAVGGVGAAGHDARDAKILADDREPLTSNDLGDPLLAIVAAARRHDRDAEAVRSATHRVVDAVRATEADQRSGL